MEGRERVRKVLHNFEEIICAVILMFMAVLCFANVIVRYLTNFSLAFSEELLVNLFVWLTLLGTAVGFKRKAHLGMTLLTNRLPKTWKRPVVALTAAVSAGLFALLAWRGYFMVLEEYESGMVTYSMGLPMWLFGLAVPVGSLIVVGRVVQAALIELRPRSKKATEGGS
jgi:TRAP-type C4-dicarboxylate transport system permease small subunit